MFAKMVVLERTRLPLPTLNPLPGLPIVFVLCRLGGGTAQEILDRWAYETLPRQGRFRLQ